MLVIIPPEWKCDLPEEISIVKRDKSIDTIVQIQGALLDGEKLFLIGVEGVSAENGWLVATDHVSLFIDSPLIGKNIDELGPRFPSLIGLYLAPDGVWGKGVVGRVPNWKLATPAELQLLKVDALISDGVDEAEICGHAGAKVLLLVRCHGWDATNEMEPPLEDAIDALKNEYNKLLSEGNEK